MQTRPLLLTLGDPNGLGPELVCRLWAEKKPDFPAILIGPESALEYHREALGMDRFWVRVESPEELASFDFSSGPVPLLVPEGLEPFAMRVGEPHVDGGRSAGASLALACSLVRTGLSGGIVTLPLNKAMLKEAGFDFPGHTEFLAREAGLRQDEVCMHLCGDRLHVSLVTTHPPLSEVPKLITRERILRNLRLTAQLVRDAGFGEGPVAVCGLNPHAGESGTIGTEEIETIIPAIEEARAEGLDVAGPFPADTVFYRAAGGEFPAVLAMYHDQGLGPLKLLHFSRAVNVTLGLPFVRTSVDHGTGYDLAGKYEADIGSLEEAVRLAGVLIEARG